jgi:hypothetical protein
MYISRIRLKNLRGFRDLDLDFRGPDGRARMRTLIIGKNGTCKTTLLRAIALGLCDYSDANALMAEPIGGLVSEGTNEGEIEILLGGSKVAIRIRKHGGKETVSSHNLTLPKPFFVCGYGAGRYGIGPDTGRDYRIADSVVSLFDYRRTLLDPELTLRRLQGFLDPQRTRLLSAGSRTPWGSGRKTRSVSLRVAAWSCLARRSAARSASRDGLTDTG